jgi:Domain of unknown function (DUF6378)
MSKKAPFDAPDVIPDESILQEAQRLIHGPRRAFYGHPLDDYTRTAGLFNSAFAHKLKEPLTPEEMMLAMILVKVSRQVNKPGRDNLTDIAGYAGCIEEASNERARRG